MSDSKHLPCSTYSIVNQTWIFDLQIIVFLFTFHTVSIFFLELGLYMVVQAILHCNSAEQTVVV